MRVLFDVWVKFGADINNYTESESQVFESIYKYIYDRIVFMWDEIELEETTNQKCAIMVYLMESPMKIQPRGYSDKLTERVLGCFNDNDAALLWDSVDRDLKKFLN